MKEEGQKRQPVPRSSTRTVIAEHPVLAALVLTFVFTALFLAFPALDPWFSSLFYDDADGFALSRAALLRLIRDIAYLLGILMVVWLIVQLILKIAHPTQPSYVRPSVTLYLLSTLVAGPVLLVNVVLKNHWGRPRPRDVELFGGDLPFVGVWDMTDHCYTNCSFVSGETSSAFWMVGFALVFPPRLRRRVAVVLGVFATLLSLNRIAFGGHFLSDVLISVGLTLLVMAIGYRVFITHPPPWLANDRLEAGLTQLGLSLRRQPRQG